MPASDNAPGLRFRVVISDTFRADMDAKQQVAELTRGAAECVTPKDLEAKISRGKPLNVKAGFDPTAPDLHIGHTVVLQKMRLFQKQGHHVQFLIGDFTGRIGDPTGKNEARKPLSTEQIEANARTYKDQVFKILDPDETEVMFNSAWFAGMKIDDFIRLASKYTVARMLERDDFEKRYKAQTPIAIHEFLYPLVQGYDSVAMKADVELGGTDQKFNLLVGRELQKDYGQDPQVIMTMPLLVGLDGVNKMSKSLDNYIGVTEPAFDQVRKTLSISDETMWKWYDLVSDRSLADIASLKAGHPMEAKKALAREIAARFHGDAAAKAALDEWEKQKKGAAPSDVPEHRVSSGIALLDALLETKVIPSKGEGRRLVAQGGITVEDTKVKDIALKLAKGSHLVKVGKHTFVRLIVS